MVTYTITIEDELGRILEDQARAEGRDSVQQMLRDMAVGKASRYGIGSGEELARSARLLDETADRMEAGEGIEATEFFEGFAARHGFEVGK